MRRYVWLCVVNGGLLAYAVYAYRLTVVRLERVAVEFLVYDHAHRRGTMPEAM